MQRLHRLLRQQVNDGYGKADNHAQNGAGTMSDVGSDECVT
jgi:hypothetical protein